MLGRLIGEDVELVIHAAAGLGTVKADPGQIEQIILNLAVNARDAMPKGGSLTLETANVDLDEGYAAAHPPATPGRYVMLAISDTGMGMDQETQLRIFEPFFTTKPEGEGTGLGLATVYGIVKQSGGHIWVSSEPGRGTTFKVYLPRVDEPAEAARPAGPPAEAPRGHETILLVEDTETLQEVIRETLEESGYTVLLASNGEEALALARVRSGPIHLLLTDVVMPKLGGGELAKLLSALRPGIRVLYMSGYTNGAISQQGVLGEGVMLLEKPFTGDELARAVREALDRVPGVSSGRASEGSE
jgi:CheY-like chemotaxis protein